MLEMDGLRGCKRTETHETGVRARPEGVAAAATGGLTWGTVRWKRDGRELPAAHIELLNVFDRKSISERWMTGTWRLENGS